MINNNYRKKLRPQKILKKVEPLQQDMAFLKKNIKRKVKNIKDVTLTPLISSLRSNKRLSKSLVKKNEKIKTTSQTKKNRSTQKNVSKQVIKSDEKRKPRTSKKNII